MSGRRQRPSALPIALALVFGPLLAVPERALAAAYTYACHNPIGYDYQHVITRLTGPDDFHAVIGDAAVRSITPCSNPQGPFDESLTAVLPANLQRPGMNPGIVQLGYMACMVKAPNPGCGNVPDDGNLRFVYICNATSNGTPCLADNWGTLTTPQTGRRYRFRIEHTGSSWKYTITDKVSGATGSKTIPDGGWSLGEGVWWGVEAYDFNSMLGPKDTDSDIDMYWMQYLRNSTGSSWQVAHPITIGRCELSLASETCTGAWPSHFKGQVYNQNYTDGDAVRFWTTAH